MKLDVIKLDGGKAGDIELSEDLFGLEPRAEVEALLAEVVPANSRGFMSADQRFVWDCMGF